MSKCDLLLEIEFLKKKKKKKTLELGKCNSDLWDQLYKIQARQREDFMRASFSYWSKLPQPSQMSAQGMRELSQSVDVVLPVTQPGQRHSGVLHSCLVLHSPLSDKALPWGDWARHWERGEYCPCWEGAEWNLLVFYHKHEEGEREKSLSTP